MDNDAVIWLMLAGGLVTLEIFSGTFYLLMLACGMVAGSIAAEIGLSMPLQTLSAAAVGVAATLALYVRRKRRAANPAADPSINLDVGQSLHIDQWQQTGANAFSARASYRGAMWDVDLAPGGTAQPGTFVIRAIHGSRLLVSGAAHDSQQSHASRSEKRG